MPTESRADTLISRAVDRADRPSDWDELDRMALQDPGVVTALWDGLRADCALRAAVSPAVAAAARVALPDALPDALPSRPVAHAPSSPARTLRSGGLGWLAACVVAGLWWLTSPGPTPAVSDEAKGPVPAVAQQASPGSMPTQFLPDIVLDAQPASSGTGYDLVVVRRAIERVQVPDLYGVGADEYGDPVATRVTPAAFTPLTEH